MLSKKYDTLQLLESHALQGAMQMENEICFPGAESVGINLGHARISSEKTGGRIAGRILRLRCWHSRRIPYCRAATGTSSAAGGGRRRRGQRQPEELTLRLHGVARELVPNRIRGWILLDSAIRRL